MKGDRDIILADLRAGNTHTSEDTPAVLRFARVSDAGQDVLTYLDWRTDDHTRQHALIMSLPEHAKAHGYDYIAVSKAAAALNRRRMRALQTLVREGLVDAWWRGGGEGSVNNFGARRFRCYALKGT